MEALQRLSQVGGVILSAFGLTGIVVAYISGALFLVLVGMVIEFFRRR